MAIGGQTLAGWDHVAQSVHIVLTTPLGSLVYCRDFGSRLYQLIDQPMNTDDGKLAVFSAVAEALKRWEPRFEVKNVAVDEAGADGKIGLILTGIYRPRALDGDFTPAGEVGTTIVIVRE